MNKVNKKEPITSPQQLSQPVKISFASIAGIITATLVVMLCIFLLSYLGSHVIDQQFFWFDNSIFKLVIPLRTPLLNKIMFGVTFLGSGTFLVIASISVIGYLYWKKRLRAALVFLFLLLSGMELNFLLKNIFERARPEFYPLVNEPSYSFPSGHSMNSCIFYTSLAFFVFRKIEKKLFRWIAIGLSGVTILLIGFSRIYLGAHYPSDVLAGFLAGLLWFCVVYVFEKVLWYLGIFRDRESTT